MTTPTAATAHDTHVDESHYWIDGIVFYACGHTEIVPAGGCPLLRWWRWWR